MDMFVQYASVNFKLYTANVLEAIPPEQQTPSKYFTELLSQRLMSMPPYSPFLHNKGEPLLFTELQSELDRLNAPGLHVAIVKTMRVDEKDDASFDLYVTAPGNPHHFAVVWLA